jgi:hypothetical protein
MLRNDCRICHGTNLDLVLKLAPTPIGDQFLTEPRFQPLYPIDLYQCQDCGLAQLLYEIQPEEIYADYIYLTGSSPGLQQHFAQYAKDVAAVVGLERGDAVVDIGSNDGTLLREFKNLGAVVIGIEPCLEIAKASNAKGIPTLGQYFRKGLLGKGSAKLITANNVVANISDLDSFMEGVVDVLADDGTFVFESFYLGDVVKNMVFDFIYHEHLSAFSIRPVKRLMERYGLQLYRVEHLQTKGGSIRYYCNRGRGNFKPEIYEREGHLYDKQTWIDFNTRIAIEREKTLNFCSQAKAQGKTIAGFGACISGTTLLYQFGLGEYIDYLLDANPAKHFRYSPGIHLKVFPESETASRKPDFVLALAWRFADDFQAAHPNVKVIRPLPCFSIS